MLSERPITYLSVNPIGTSPFWKWEQSCCKDKGKSTPNSILRKPSMKYITPSKMIWISYQRSKSKTFYHSNSIFATSLLNLWTTRCYYTFFAIWQGILGAQIQTNWEWLSWQLNCYTVSLWTSRRLSSSASLSSLKFWWSLRWSLSSLIWLNYQSGNRIKSQLLCSYCARVSKKDTTDKNPNTPGWKVTIWRVSPE